MAADILEQEKSDQSNEKVWEEASKGLAEQIVLRVWRQVPMSHVANVLDAESFGEEGMYCVCKEDIDDEPQIECGNIYCQNGRWFHLGCVNNPKVRKKADWFCSEECRASGLSAFCVCRKRRKVPSVKCARSDCTRGSIFHISCVNMHKSAKKVRWFCSGVCRVAAGEKGDEVKDYVEQALWRCLLHEAMREAEVEADREAMLAHWRIYLPELWNRRHASYLWVAHQFLAKVASRSRGCRLTGEVEEQAASAEGAFLEDITRNFQAFRRLSSSPQATITMKRTGDLIASLHHQLRLIFSGLPVGSKPSDGRQGTDHLAAYKADVQRFLLDFKKDGLFRSKEGRRLDGTFKRFMSDGIPDAEYLQRCLDDHSQGI